MLNKNSYHILRFNFSGIDTSSLETTINGFKNKVALSVEYFSQKYKMDFFVNYQQEAEQIINSLFIAFSIQKPNEKIYVIIEEYDHFANELLGFKTEDVKYLMKELEISEEKQKELLPIIKTNYDGYVFSNTIKENIKNYRMYNPNMTLYFLSTYMEENETPEQFVDINILSDYRKIEAFMDLCQNMNKIGILEKIVAGEAIESDLTEKFNAEIAFGEKELISLLYYLGYLTIKENEFGILKFGSPNDVVKKIYSEYFLE